MTNKKQLSPEEVAAPEFSYFAIQSTWGATKHFGGLKATAELAELCHIAKDKYVLEVGVGAGLTPRYIAKKYGCRVVGVDLSAKDD